MDSLAPVNRDALAATTTLSMPVDQLHVDETYCWSAEESAFAAELEAAPDHRPLLTNRLAALADVLGTPPMLLHLPPILATASCVVIHGWVVGLYALLFGPQTLVPVRLLTDQLAPRDRRLLSLRLQCAADRPTPEECFRHLWALDDGATLAQSLSAFAQFLGISATHVKNLYRCYRSDRIRPYIATLGVKSALAFVAAEKTLDPIVYGELLDRALREHWTADAVRLALQRARSDTSSFAFGLRDIKRLALLEQALRDVQHIHATHGVFYASVLRDLPAEYLSFMQQASLIRAALAHLISEAPTLADHLLEAEADLELVS